MLVLLRYKEHYGHISTLRVESAHEDLTKCIKTSTGTCIFYQYSHVCAVAENFHLLHQGQRTLD